MKLRTRKDYRQTRHARVRRGVRGTAERPRMAIMISNKHIYVQFIDDDRGVTLASASTAGASSRVNVATAKLVGEKAGKAAQAKGITTAVVDRGGFKFHGRLKALVDAVNGAGIATRSKEAK